MKLLLWRVRWAWWYVWTPSWWPRYWRAKRTDYFVEWPGRMKWLEREPKKPKY